MNSQQSQSRTTNRGAQRPQSRLCEALRLFLGLTACVAVYALPAPLDAAQVRSEDIRVVDGDTIDLGEDRYRLVGFDTPETYHAKCNYELVLGNAATDRLITLVATAGVVDLVILPGRDRYDRGLARLFVSGLNVADILIAEGLARPYHGGKRKGWC